MRAMLVFLSVLAIACGGSKQAPAPASKTKAPAAGVAAPYMHECGDTGKRCDTDECEKWKTDHGTDAQAAREECMQDCNCGE
jgi:hypothetical protein